MAKKKSTTRKKSQYGGAIGRSAAGVKDAWRGMYKRPPPPLSVTNPAMHQKIRSSFENRKPRSTGGVMKVAKPN